MKKTILVTGGTGVIGLSIIQFFYKKGFNVAAAGISKADINASMADGDNPNVTNWLYMNAVEVPCCVVI